MEKRYQADLDTSHQFLSPQVSSFQFKNRYNSSALHKTIPTHLRKRNLHPTTFKNYKSEEDG